MANLAARRPAAFTAVPPKVHQPDLTYVLLGAYGDICIMLPLFYQQFRRTGKKTGVVVAQYYASLFEGTSYIEPIIWPGDYSQVAPAVQHAKQMVKKEHLRFLNPPPRIVQAYGNRTPRLTDSFAKEMWRLGGQPEHWDKLPLIFDKRDEKRESELVKSLSEGKPMILVAPEGRSSPFPSREKPDKNLLLDAIRSAFPDHTVVDLSQVKCERIYDLLGLYDAAKLLVSVDTVHLHLSRASKVPVIALCADTPTLWHGSPGYSNQLLRLRYSEFPSRLPEMLQVMRKMESPAALSPLSRLLIHVYSDYDRQGDTLRRYTMAKRTWDAEYRFGEWSPMPVHDRELIRDATIVGEKRKLPFVRDLIEKAAMREGASDTDIIVLTNEDTCFVPGIAQQIVNAIESNGACYAHRWDFTRVMKPLVPVEIRKGKWFAGSDLFAFTIDWWKQHCGEFPDMLTGVEAWDWILRELIKSKGGCEIFEAIYHEWHPPQWYKERKVSEGNKYNRRLAREWLTARNMDLRELKGVD